ncbi:L,D-transpeptidase [Synechococcus sp. CC9616]|uniref:L,D-transpeptidase n=1 Tax=Synechococcus sp. CC9616 TaxID=110663 RepID=UPI00048CD6C5|nr:L,D-transpeptidase [Synechococcus sp. CC9616]
MTIRPILLASLISAAVGVAGVTPAQAETSIQISLKNRYLTLFDDGKVIGKYPVAIGAPESPTPAGSYAITKMEPAPTYHKKGKVIAPGPKNPVGVRYMAYVQIGTGEYAIHGTAWPNWVKLRSAVSLGCIRMLNNDVIQVFNRVKVGTPVLVTTN